MTKDRDALSAALSQRSPGGHPPLLMTKSGGSAQEKLMGTGQARPCGRLTEETPWDVGHGENHTRGKSIERELAVTTSARNCSSVLSLALQSPQLLPPPHPPTPSSLCSQAVLRDPASRCKDVLGSIKNLKPTVSHHTVETPRAATSLPTSARISPQQPILVRFQAKTLAANVSMGFYYFFYFFTKL